MKLKFAKPKKQKKTPLKKKLDALFSRQIRAIGFCQAEGKSKIKCGGGLQCCHIIGRNNMRLRWEPRNVLCMCAGHHRYFTDKPFEWVEFILEYYPEKYNFVMEHREEKVKFSVGDYQKFIAFYEKN